MNSSGERHELEALGGYVLGALDREEALTVEHHLDGCGHCRAAVPSLYAVRQLLDQAPAEAFLDGPPPEHDLVLPRVLRQVRAERRAPVRRLAIRLTAVAAAVSAVAAGGAALTVRGADAGRVPTAVAPAGRVIGPVTDPASGARLMATVTPKPGWVMVHVQVSGVAAGERCRLVVVARNGRREVAGSWLVSSQAARSGSAIDGAAEVPPDQVGSIEVERADGTPLVSANT